MVCNVITVMEDLNAGLNAQGEGVSFICAQTSVSHFSCHWGRKNRDLTVLY